MADMMKTGSEWIAGQLNAHASRPVVYTRGVQSVTVRASGGPKPLAVSGDSGTRIVWSNGDYLIDAAALDFGGGPVEPAKGDTIAETLGGVPVVCEVRPPQQGEDVWRWADAYGIKRRIHSKQVAQE